MYAEPAAMPSTTSSVAMPRCSASCGDGRRAPELLRQLVGRPAQPQVGLLGRPGHPHGPRVIAEVALDLALDRPPGERREGDVAVGLEAVDGLDQGQEGDLAQVVVARPAPSEAAGDVGGEAHVPLDELVAQAPVAGGAELAEQCVLVATRSARRSSPTGCGSAVATQARCLGERERRCRRARGGRRRPSTIRRVSSSSSIGPADLAVEGAAHRDAHVRGRRTRGRPGPPCGAPSTSSETSSLTPRRRSSRSSTLSPPRRRARPRRPAPRRGTAARPARSAAPAARASRGRASDRCDGSGEGVTAPVWPIRAPTQPASRGVSWWLDAATAACARLCTSSLA